MVCGTGPLWIWWLCVPGPPWDVFLVKSGPGASSVKPQSMFSCPACKSFSFSWHIPLSADLKTQK